MQFSIRGSLKRRTAGVLLIIFVLAMCALLAPDIVVEIARLLKSISP